MLTQISPDIHFLQSTKVMDHDYKSGINVIQILLKNSWHTHLKYYNTYTFIVQKENKPRYGFCTRLCLSTSIILIFVGIFLDRLSKIIKFKLNWIMVSTPDFASQSRRTRSETTK